MTSANALYLVFKLVCRLSTNWRSINAPNQLALLLAGHLIVDGKLQLDQSTEEGIAAYLQARQAAWKKFPQPGCRLHLHVEERSIRRS